MTIIVTVLLLGVSLLAVSVWLNPKLRYRYTPRPINLPADVETYLSQSEGAVVDIIEGANKTIIWADPTKKQKTALSIVYLHGFTACRQETAPLADNLARQLGANLFYTRLTGHGRTNGDGLGTATVSDWLNDAVEALEIGRRLGDKVILMGKSTGATLVVWLVGSHAADDVVSLVLLSPNFWVKDRRSVALLLPWAHTLAVNLLGPTVYGRGLNEAHKKYWAQAYPINALLTMMGVVYLMRNLDLRRITQPLFIAYAAPDQLISVAAIKKLFPRFGSDTKTLYEVTSPTKDPLKHVIAGDILAPESTAVLQKEIATFLEKEANIELHRRQPD